MIHVPIFAAVHDAGTPPCPVWKGGEGMRRAPDTGLPLRLYLNLATTNKVVRAEMQLALPQLIINLLDENWFGGCDMGIVEERLCTAVETFGMQKCRGLVLPRQGYRLLHFWSDIFAHTKAYFDFLTIPDQSSFQFGGGVNAITSAASVDRVQVVLNTMACRYKWAPDDFPRDDETLDDASYSRARARALWGSINKVLDQTRESRLETFQIDFAAYYNKESWVDDVEIIGIISRLWEVQPVEGFEAYLSVSIVPFVGCEFPSTRYAVLRECLEDAGCPLEAETAPLEEVYKSPNLGRLVSVGQQCVGFPRSSAAMRMVFIRNELAAAEVTRAAGEGLDLLSWVADSANPLHQGGFPSVSPEKILLCKNERDTADLVSYRRYCREGGLTYTQAREPAVADVCRRLGQQFTIDFGEGSIMITLMGVP